ncbi:MAG: DUF4416 family protein [Desulfosarcinaceae bacterium]|jgi:hypothetical protein
MSHPQPAQPAKLVIGAIVKDRSLLESVADELVRNFGPLDLISPWYSFDYTTYYDEEMGAPLHRRLLVFQNLIFQEELVRVKLGTNALEQSLAVRGARRVNLDPGYLLLERFVLATGKNFSHRIYLGQGIYADLTLIYRQGAFQTLPWTYPDYATQRIRGFLLQARRRYREDLKCPARPLLAEGAPS